ncbi:MAG TPA: PKD domain-containing protein, partial [Dyadobacter sp.]|nr:PKD domain-containing protein [Dyadobacter sp.]
MIKNVLFLLILILYSFAAQATGMYFIENKGQWDADVLFRTDIPGGFLFLKKQSFVYTFYDASKVADLHGKSVSGSVTASKAPDLNSISAHGVEVKLVGASATTALKPHKPVHTRFSYFLRDGVLAGDVQGFEEVVYANVYQGIDLRIYMHNAVLKYEYIVSPNARAGDIAMKYEGASDLSLNSDGQIIVKTPLSSFKENVPYSFQKLKDKTVEVKSKFSFKDGNLISFVLPEGYDKSQSLVIDPELIFSTYSGSLADNWGHTATYDNEGNLYSAGTVFGTNFPATTGAFQIRFQGLVDVAVLKFNPDGSDLLYATYLGGSSTDIPNSLIVNSKKELLILGTTSSRNFPVTGSAFQKEFGGGSAAVPISGLNLPNGSDIFIAKLSADGKQLLASTYLGGSGNDGLSLETGVKVKNYGDSFRGEIIVDKIDQIYAVTSTNSENFPLRNADKTTLTGRQD